VRSTRLFASLAVAACAALIPQPAAAQATVGGYAALGDSYAAGVGTADYIATSGECYRGNWAHPAVWAAANKPATFAFAACSGATTTDVINNQLGVLDKSTSLVTITVGGNDIGFSDVLTACTLGDDQTCVDRTNQAKLYAIVTLPGRLDRVYTSIHERAPSAEVVALGYPHIAVATGSCAAFSPTKRAALNSAADILAEVTAERASTHDVIFKDMRGVFAGHEVCSDKPWLNGLTSPLMESYHPNRDGQWFGYLAVLDSVVTGSPA